MKKFTSLFLCLCMVLGLALSANAIIPGEDAVSNPKYAVKATIFDLETGEKTEKLFDYTKLVAAVDFLHNWNEGETFSMRDVAPAQIIGGVDDRVKVTNTEAFPHSAVCYLEAEVSGYSEPFVGTAFMVSPYVAVTAAHCVSDGTTMASEVKVWPGKDGYGLWNNPYGTAKSVAIFTDNWDGQSSGPSDFAIIALKEDIGNDCGWFGLEWNHGDAANQTFTISGYPWDESNDDYQYYQYTASGLVIEAVDYYLYHRIDATSGQSGAPLYNSSNVVYGIHTGSSKVSQTYNIANRITKPIYLFIQDYINTYG